MNIIIEDASAKMLETLHDIEKQSFKEEAFSKHQLAILISDYNSISLVAKVEGEIAGFVIGRIDVVQDKEVGHIMTLDVAPTYRRKGVATRLMTEVETILKKRNVILCVLEVREDNAAALSLYEKLGYKRTMQLNHYYGRAHGLYLEKSLSP